MHSRKTNKQVRNLVLVTPRQPLNKQTNKQQQHHLISPEVYCRKLTTYFEFGNWVSKVNDPLFHKMVETIIKLRTIKGPYDETLLLLRVKVTESNLP